MPPAEVRCGPRSRLIKRVDGFGVWCMCRDLDTHGCGRMVLALGESLLEEGAISLPTLVWYRTEAQAKKAKDRMREMGRAPTMQVPFLFHAQT